MASIGLYNSFFGLTERPFTLLPDPDFLFWSEQHRRAFTVLEYGLLTHAPITVLTGEVGAGKTTLIQELLKSVDHTVTVGLISNAQGGRGELLRWVLNALSVSYDATADYVGLFQALQTFLLEEYAMGRRVVLIIDEAQNLNVETLEELRMLTNINANKDELVQLILVGQPELADLVSRPELRQFAQRVVASYHLGPLDLAAVEHYITHRLRHAGGTGNEFTSGAIREIFQVSGGVPRIVNKLCDFAMVYASTSDQPLILKTTIQNVVSDGVFISTRDRMDRAAE